VFFGRRAQTCGRDAALRPPVAASNPGQFMDTPEQPPPSGPKKVRIKAGNFEFEAEGAIDDYRESLAQFVALVEKVGDRLAAPASGGATAPGTNQTITPGTGAINLGGEPPTVEIVPPASAGIGEDTIARLFRRDGDGISLLALPKGDDGGADAVIALLYGFNRLLNRSAVTGVTLMKAAKQSGVNIPRVDTTMAKREDYVLAAGARRGRVYSLNNRGVQYAESVLRRTLE
jgi:hypothetical protein